MAFSKNLNSQTTEKRKVQPQTFFSMLSNCRRWASTPAQWLREYRAFKLLTLTRTSRNQAGLSIEITCYFNAEAPRTQRFAEFKNYGTSSYAQFGFQFNFFSASFAISALKKFRKKSIAVTYRIASSVALSCKVLPKNSKTLQLRD